MVVEKKFSISYGYYMLKYLLYFTSLPEFHYDKIWAVPYHDGGMTYEHYISWKDNNIRYFYVYNEDTGNSTLRIYDDSGKDIIIDNFKYKISKGLYIEYVK